VQRLKQMGVRRTIQMPGMGVLTMPGYAFHFTNSQGLNLAESANMFLEVMGWTFDKLWKVRLEWSWMVELSQSWKIQI
jgi:hypothetical protein